MLEARVNRALQFRFATQRPHQERSQKGLLKLERDLFCLQPRVNLPTVLSEGNNSRGDLAPLGHVLRQGVTNRAGQKGRDERAREFGASSGLLADVAKEIVQHRSDGALAV